MSNQFETERLILRKVTESDEDRFYLMDSNPEVVKFVEPPKNRQQVQMNIAGLQTQYKENGIGRYAVVEKESGLFIGWSGLRFYRETVNNHSNFYDLGYRFLQEYWGRGYATETSKFWLDYAFNTLNLNEVFATTDVKHQDSKNVLLKVGFKWIETFDDEGDLTDWWKIENCIN
jgi:ribosomal-protein-alanine N-acetyltransferase